MRLEIFGGRELSSFQRSAALAQAEMVFASRGVLLSDVVEAIAADARKELPVPWHWGAYVDAEHAALQAAFGSASEAGDAVLGVVVDEADMVKNAAEALVIAGVARIKPCFEPDEQRPAAL